MNTWIKKYTRGSIVNYCAIIDSSDHARIAHINRTADDEQDEKNARLIAAAPELLQALTALVNDTIGRPGLLSYYHDMNNCENPDNCAHCQLINNARAIIQKATAQ